MGAQESKPFACMACNHHSPSRYSLSSTSGLPINLSQTVFVAENLNFSDSNDTIISDDPVLPLPDISDEEHLEPSTLRINPQATENQPRADPIIETLYIDSAEDFGYQANLATSVIS